MFLYVIELYTDVIELYTQAGLTTMTITLGKNK